MKKGLAGLVAVTWWLFSASTALSQPQDVNLSALIEQIKGSEQKLLNLKVSGASQSEKWDPGTGQWAYNGESEFTAWYTGMPGSKAKVVFHKRVLPWTDGAQPFSSSRIEYAYNGRVGQMLRHEANGQKLLRGAIEAERPKSITLDGAATGWSLSLYGAVESERRRLSDLLSQWQDVGVAAERLTLNGSPCVRIALTQENVRRCWYLDPERQFAFLRFEAFTG